MFKIQKFKVNGFWHRLTAECDFNDDVNVIIGRNGTGKTTFMNILHAILVVDMDKIIENDFDSIEIYLSSGKKRKKITAVKVDDPDLPFVYMEYKISRKNYKFRIVPSESRAVYRNRSLNDMIEVKTELDKIVSVSSLSVYRSKSDDEYEVRTRRGEKILSSVDYRLSKILEELTSYQLELSQEARSVATGLQKDVLTSILFSKEDMTNDIELSFDMEAEKLRLKSAYKQLNVWDTQVNKKINYHVNAIDKSIKNLKKSISDDDDIKPSDTLNIMKSLVALNQTSSIIEMSLIAEELIDDIYSQVQLYHDTIKLFIRDKEFELEDAGNLNIVAKSGPINYQKLSSGEKQLLILLTEALLQKKEPHVFLADEPELSLHIAWQKMIIPAVRDLNPNAQVIVATHSPEVAGKFADSIIDMEDITDG